MEAYQDLLHVLDAITAKLHKTRGTLRIYDPYFCAGGMVASLASLGFTSVHNPCEDFYRVVKENRLPDFDVLVTNPPYSSDHPARLIEFVKQCGKPWALLMPNWVYMKEYYDRAIQGAIYVAPRKRYYYWTPKALKRAKHTHSGPMGERTSPFISFWYIGPGGFQDAIVRQWGAEGRQAARLRKRRRSTRRYASVQHACHRELWT